MFKGLNDDNKSGCLIISISIRGPGLIISLTVHLRILAYNHSYDTCDGY